MDRPHRRGCKAAGLNYSKFMHGMKLAGVTLDRKVLSEIAYADQTAFAVLVEQAKSASGGGSEAWRSTCISCPRHGR